MASSLSAQQLTLLEFDKITVGFPQNNILSIESLNEINKTENAESSSGTLMYSNSELPIYTLDKNLKLQTQIMDNNRFCIAFKHPESSLSFALMCDAVEQYQLDEDAVTSDIPTIMRNPKNPLTKLVKDNNSLILLSTAELIRDCINTQDPSYLESA